MLPDFAPTPGLLINRASRAFVRISDARLRRIGSAYGHLPVIMALKGGRALPQTELARIARIEQPSMAQLLNRMERDGLIQRTPDPNDGRKQLVSLTSSAVKNMAKGRSIIDETNREALEGFTAEEAGTLLMLLQRVNDNLERVSSAMADP